MIDRKALCYVLLFAVVLGALPLASGGRLVPAASTYHNEKYKFSIEPPPGWTVDETEKTAKEGAILLVTVLGPVEKTVVGRVEQSFQVGFNIAIGFMRPPMTVEEYWTRIGKDEVAGFQDAQFLSEGLRTLGGLPAYESVNTFTLRGFKVKGKQVMVVTPDRSAILVLSFSATPETYGKYIDIFEQSLTTFKFDEEPGLFIDPALVGFLQIVGGGFIIMLILQAIQMIVKRRRAKPPVPPPSPNRPSEVSPSEGGKAQRPYGALLMALFALLATVNLYYNLEHVPRINVQIDWSIYMVVWVIVAAMQYAFVYGLWKPKRWALKVGIASLGLGTIMSVAMLLASIALSTALNTYVLVIDWMLILWNASALQGAWKFLKSPKVRDYVESEGHPGVLP